MTGSPPTAIRDTVRGLLMLASGEHDDVVRRELFALPPFGHAAPACTVARASSIDESGVTVRLIDRPSRCRPKAPDAQRDPSKKSEALPDSIATATSMRHETLGTEGAVTPTRYPLRLGR